MSNLTLLETLVAALQRASAYNRNDQLAPVAVLWPDQERLWEPLIARLRVQLPSLLTFGPYRPAQRSGPAYWLRCMLARTLADPLPEDATPIIYLPGVSRADLRAVEECPRPLQPLAELQYRGVIWSHRNGREWTPAGFLQAADGAAVELASDASTREALQRALPRLLDEPLSRLRSAAPLRADFFDALLTPDTPRSLLLWLNNPAHVRQQLDANAWTAFVTQVQRSYGLNPERDGQLSGIARLGSRQGPWAHVWVRFVEAPDSYPHLPELLRRARPPQLSLFDIQETWPQDNETAEQKLREQLLALRTAHLADARAELGQLEREHAPRRAWVWARLGQSPLAQALAHLHELVTYTTMALHGSTVAAIVEGYRDYGWRADAAALQALACVEQAGDLAAVSVALRAIYQPWLEQSARAFQAACLGAPYPAALPSAAIAPGVCLLFCDALRYDLGQRLGLALQQQGLHVELSANLAPFPGITPTAKPAVAPVAAAFTGSGASELTPLLAARQSKASAEVLRGELEWAGFQLLSGSATGDPSGRAWCELGAIDSYGHQHGVMLAHHVSAELRTLERRISELLQAGWQQVVVVTDHGWLLLPGALPNVNLPITLTVVRKERCARLKPLALGDQQTLPWFWDAAVAVATPPGIACYEAGHTYAHGGLSAQECVTPLLRVSRSGATAVRITRIEWRGLRCTVTVEGDPALITVDLRRRAADAQSSLLISPRRPSDSGSAALLVEDEDRMGASAMVVVLAEDGSLLSQRATTVGGA